MFTKRGGQKYNQAYKTLPGKEMGDGEYIFLVEERC
jgi:hypothetical protein